MLTEPIQSNGLQYVFRPPHGDPLFAPPYSFKAELTSFIVWGRYQKLKETCDRGLNAALARSGVPFRYMPLPQAPGGKSLVFLEIIRYDEMRSTKHHDRGFDTQNEMLFGFPVVRYLGIVPVGVAFFTPYVFVDNDWSVLAGREVIGYPKMLAEFDLPPDTQHTEVRTRVFERYGQNEKPSQQTVLSILEMAGDAAAAGSAASRSSAHRGSGGGESSSGGGESSSGGGESSGDGGDDCAPGGSPPGGHSMQPPRPPAISLTPEEAQKIYPFGPIDPLFAAGGLQPQSDTVLSLLNQAAGIELGGIAFKEFREAQEPEFACYQGVVEFSTKVKQFIVGLLPDWSPQITLKQYASLKIGDDLGLERQGDQLRSLLMFSYHAGFELVDAKTICSSSHPGLGAPSGCWGAVAEGFDLTREVIEQQAEQCREAAKQMRQGSYGVGAAIDHAVESTKLCVGYYVDLAALWFTVFGGKAGFTASPKSGGAK